MTSEEAPLALEDMRILPSEIGPVIPVLDIVRNIGYTRSAISKALGRHKNAFKGLTVSLPLDTGIRGIQPYLCLNETGIQRLLFLLEPSAETKPDLRDRVEAFKLKKLLQMGGNPAGETALTITPLPATPQAISHRDLIEALEYHGRAAKVLVELYEYPKETARRLAMAAVVEECGDEANFYKGPALLTQESEDSEPLRKDGPQCEHCNGSLGSCDPDYDRFYSTRKLAKYTNKTEDEVKNILDKEGLISWAHGIYSLTVLGRQFGKVFITYPEWPHRTYEQKNIRWSPAALERVRTHINSAQQTLAQAPG